jgi:hypothetical protein
MLTSIRCVLYKVVNEIIFMSKPVGGRGHKAPYVTTHVRVPEPVKPDVERLIEDYRSGVPGRYVTKAELIEICEAILLKKKSASKSFDNLLTVLFEHSNTAQ